MEDELQAAGVSPAGTVPVSGGQGAGDLAGQRAGSTIEQLKQGAMQAGTKLQDTTRVAAEKLRSPSATPIVLGAIMTVSIAVVLTFMARISQPPHPVPLKLSDVTAPRITLPDGRQIAWREQGASKTEAKHSLLVLHGLWSSRLAGMCGVSDELLKEYSVRLVTYDRPGYGQSDPHPNRTLESSARDMAAIADTLGMGQKFWVLGYSGGGPHAWAAAKFIPERIAGVAQWAPGGNPWAANITKEERAWFVQTPLYRKLQWMLAKYAPGLLPPFMQVIFLPQMGTILNRQASVVGPSDAAMLENPQFKKGLWDDVRESTYQNSSLPIAQELLLSVRDWGFELSELQETGAGASFSASAMRMVGLGGERVFSGPIHIWQGSDDRHVPLGVNLYAKRMIPRAQLHVLEGEGHFSWYCFCERCHRSVLDTLFGTGSASA